MIKSFYKKLLFITIILFSYIFHFEIYFSCSNQLKTEKVKNFLKKMPGMTKIKNKIPPCNCSKSSRCVRCPCYKLINGVYMNTCTNLCDCSNNCISKSGSYVQTRYAAQNTDYSLNQEQLINQESPTPAPSIDYNNQNKVMNLSIIEFKNLLKSSIIEYQVDLIRQIQSMIQCQEIQKNTNTRNNQEEANKNHSSQSGQTNEPEQQQAASLDLMFSPFSLLSPRFMFPNNEF